MRFTAAITARFCEVAKLPRLQQRTGVLLHAIQFRDFFKVWQRSMPDNLEQEIATQLRPEQA